MGLNHRMQVIYSQWRGTLRRDQGTHLAKQRRMVLTHAEETGFAEKMRSGEGMAAKTAHYREACDCGETVLQAASASDFIGASTRPWIT